MLNLCSESLEDDGLHQLVVVAEEELGEDKEEEEEEEEVEKEEEEVGRWTPRASCTRMGRW